MVERKLELEKTPFFTKKEKRGTDFLWERLPHISLYQLRITGVASYAGIFGGMMAMYPVFAQYRPPYRCETVFDNNDEFSWLTWEQIKSLTTRTPFCSGYEESKLSAGCGHCVFDPISINTCDHREDYQTLQDCLGQSAQEMANWTTCSDEFNFDRSLRNITNRVFDAGEPWETAVTQFKLICGEEWFDSLTTSLTLFSLIMGAYISGIYADKFGRKHAIMVWSTISGVCLALLAFMPDRYGFLVMRVLSNGFGHISDLAYVTYSMELLGPKRRAISGSLANIYFSFGYMASSVIGYCFPDWREFTLAYAGVAFATLLTFPFYPESPSILYSQGRKEEARKIFKEIGRKTDTEIDDALLEKVEADILKKDDDETKAEQYTILDLFRHKDLAFVSLMVGFAFCVNTLVYYGLSLNVASFAGSVYVNNVINGALEFPAYVAVAISVDKFGRRLTNSGFMIGGGIACLGCMALEEAARNSDDPAFLLEIQRWMAFTGKFFISGSFGTTYLYATELFPTPLRITGLGFGSMSGRIGAIVSPFIIQMKNASIIYAIFGFVGLIGGALIFILPETAGHPVCQTLEEALDFYAMSKSSRKTVCLGAQHETEKENEKYEFQTDF